MTQFVQVNYVDSYQAGQKRKDEWVKGGLDPLKSQTQWLTRLTLLKINWNYLENINKFL